MLEFDLEIEQSRREREDKQQAEEWAVDLSEIEQMLRRWGGRQFMRGVAHIYGEVFKNSVLKWSILSSAYMSMHAAAERDPVAGTTDEF